MRKDKDLEMKCAAASAPVGALVEISAVVGREAVKAGDSEVRVDKEVDKAADRVVDAVDNKNKKGCWES